MALIGRIRRSAKRWRSVSRPFGVCDGALFEGGLDDALNRRPQPERPSKRIFDGEKEAHLIALTCGEKPEGEGRWSVRLLAERFVKLGEVEQVSHETVRQVLKKTSSSRG